MKTFLIILTFLIFFTGCSKKNAFFEFKMNKIQELSVSSLQTSKITSKSGEVTGVFSAIYLNEIYPESFYGDEYFFVFFFIKDAKEMYDPKNPTDTDLRLKLNSKLPIKIQKLPEENRFSHLVDIKSDWNGYYIVAFEKADEIGLVLESGQSSSAVIKYKKD